MAALYFLCSSLLALSIFYPGCALRDAAEDSARKGDDILTGDSIYQMVVDGQQISRSRPERGTVLLGFMMGRTCWDRCEVSRKLTTGKCMVECFFMQDVHTCSLESNLKTNNMYPPLEFCLNK